MLQYRLGFLFPYRTPVRGTLFPNQSIRFFVRCGFPLNFVQTANIRQDPVRPRSHRLCRSANRS